MGVCVCLFAHVGLDGSVSRLPQLCPAPSVSLVFTVVSPAPTHGRHHDGVHVEPGLTQRRREGLAKAALKHVEERLTHHLKGRRRKNIEQTSQKRDGKWRENTKT